MRRVGKGAARAVPTRGHTFDFPNIAPAAARWARLAALARGQALPTLRRHPQLAANFNSLIASKSWMPPPTRFVV